MIAVLGVATLVGAACSPGPGTSPTTLSGTLTTRTVALSLSGPASVTVNAPAAADGVPAGFAFLYDSSSNITKVTGTLAFDNGIQSGSVTANLTAGPLGMDGSVSVSESTSGISTTISGTSSDLTADDHGDISFTIANATSSLSMTTTSVALAPGTSPELEALLAAEGDFCAEGQAQLAGLDAAEVPVASIINTLESPRAAFAGSKAIVDPLTVRTWTEAGDVSDAGEHRTVSKRISCKMRAADHIATTGVSTSASDAQCSELNQKSLDLALAQMTPAQQADVTVPALGPDVVRQTGSEWTTPLAAGIEFDGTTLRAHALLTEWNDPAFVLFPDTIRGVHYCTTWSPSHAYATLLDTIPAPVA